MAGRHTCDALRPLLRRPLLLALAALCLLAGAVPATAAAGDSDGIYESCAPDGGVERCIDRLQQLRDGGFRTVLNYATFYATEDQLLAYAQAARQLGIKLILPLKDEPWWGRGKLTDAYPELARTCSCRGDRGFTKYVVGLFKRSHAVWGYYVGDEPPPRATRKIKRFSRRLHRLDRRHPRLLVVAGDLRTAKPQLKKYAKAVDVLGADIYPVGTSLPLGSVRKIGRIARSAAGRSRGSAIVLQAFSWSQYPGAASAIRLPNPLFPSALQMKRMRRMAGRQELVMWFSYPDVISSPLPALNWSSLLAAAR